MKITKRKLLCLLLGVILIACTCSIGAFADTAMLSPEDGMVSDSGTDSAFTPEAGTVQGGDGTSVMDGTGIMGDAESALEDVSEGVSDAVSDVLGVPDGTGSGAADSTDGTDDEGGSAAAAVIIFIIIAIAVIALVLVLVPKRRG